MTRAYPTKRQASNKDKRAYVQGLLSSDPMLDDRTLGQLVMSKFGSGLARRNMDEVRRGLGWTWSGTGRGRKLVQIGHQTAQAPAQTAASSGGAPSALTAPNNAQAPAQAAHDAALTEDERREVELIGQLQALMQRQGYREIMIPATGQAHIKLAVIREKRPGEHVSEPVAATR